MALIDLARQAVQKQEAFLPMRRVGVMEKIMTRLLSPAGSLVKTTESIRYGYEALAFRLRAESMMMGMQYVVNSFVQGDVAEFGTFSGQTALVIARAMKIYRASESTIFHLFDSFEGMPEAKHPLDVQNPHVASGVWGAGRYKGLSENELKRRCAKFISARSIMTHKGWFADTLPLLPQSTRFAFVHIDGDLYSSTKDILDSLFGRRMVSEGAALFFDDWDCGRADNRQGERKAWAEAVAKYNIVYEDICTYSWAGRRFLVHSY